MNEDTIICFGDTIKALGNGKVGGYLVKFTSAAQPDLVGDFFDRATDFDIEPGDPTRIYYNHGLDPTLKRRKLGTGTLTIDDTGVWVEAQLALRDDYERAIYSLAEAGKLGWSSGTLPNLVEREPAGKAIHIKAWPLGKDASLTPTPAAGLVATQALPLKTWEVQLKQIDLQERLRLVSDAIDKKFNPRPSEPIAYERTSEQPYTYAEYIYDKFVVIRKGAQRWRIPYTVEAGNVIALGEATEVEMSWVTVKGFLGQFDDERQEWVTPGQPDDIQASDGKAAAPEADRSSAVDATIAAKLTLEIELMEVEL
jgi:hypothetical protein